MNEYKAVAADDAPPPAGAPAVRLRNEFSVCRVYTSNGTLRSFDRRPLNPPAGGGLDQAAAHRCQQQEALPVPPPPPPPASQMAAVDAVAASNGQSSEHSHGSSSSSGSLGVVVDGAEDAAAAIDWDALIPPVDYLRFSVDDLSHVVWPPN
ncbi:NAC domain-containing protein 90-like [Panicum miliaceum]|uniref:NAC domain-containing protein 90-like n=1 Tax=Panicum miliaceum TaxID=4540 RepID=A0A3L6PIZ3_PANMI|nr:NAC domain-containing protein 90-like [Panicum miliaceum]